MDDHTNAIVSSDHVTKTLPCNSKCTAGPVWTFNTSENWRIKIIFQNFDFGEQNGYLEIVDKNSEGYMTTTGLNGTSLPTNLISVSNALTIAVQIPCTSNYSGIKFYAKIKAEKYSGKHLF